MRSTYIAIFTVLLGSSGLCAPTASVDADVFLQNGHDAQALNARFATLKASDACNNGEIACIKDSIAHCVNATWQLAACPKTLSCFALPSVREQGTVLSCTSNVTALSVINASGATGGISANSTSNSTSLPVDCNGDDESDDDQSSSTNSTSVTTNGGATQTRKSSQTTLVSDSTTSTTRATTTDSTETSIVTGSTNPTASGTASGANSAVTVTVTVVPTTTLPSETFTLDPSAASSLLSSLATESDVSITTIVHSAKPTVTTTITTTVAESGAPLSGASAPTDVASAPPDTTTSKNVPPPTITLVGSTRAARSAATATEAADGGYYGSR